MEKKSKKFIYWTPRILSIVFLLFLAMLSLDVFESGLTVWQIAIGLLMHNIPVFILSLLLWISWKYEIVGGIVFILAGLLYTVRLIRNPFEWYVLFWVVQIAGIAFLIGILFLICWSKKKK
ncbi:hypothetical protein HY500_00320 [Candidatus Woesearchaeota archaeon]|nr:hypothetical protein [Candidatus Woesearchaeota archaeon]